MSEPENPSPRLPEARQLTVREISEEQHARFLQEHPEASFLQNPRWAQVKVDWTSQRLGFHDGDQLVGAALVLFRRLPVPLPWLKDRSLAYIAEGPVFDQDELALESVLPPLVDHLAAAGAFLIRVGLPGVVRRWDGADVRRALAAGEHSSVTELTPLWTDPRAPQVHRQLEQLGWSAPSESAEFEAGQPQFQARIPLQPELDAEPYEVNQNGESPALEAALGRMDSTSRRQTRKSTRSELTVSVGSAADLPAWHRLYQETAERDGFTGRPLAYFERMHAELNAAPDTECTLYLAHFGEQLLAAAIYVRQGGFGWYVYGASSSEERKRYAPRALQLRQIQDSIAAGCTWYDLGGMSPSLDPEYELAGLTRFKTTMGADVVQTHGEWDYPVNRLLTKAFTLYMDRRR